MRATTLTAVLATLAFGCEGLGQGSVEADDFEGDDAGECDDGADNDRNGYFDCQDNGCWNSPICMEGDADTDADADADTDVDADADADIDDSSCANDLTSLESLTYSATFRFEPPEVASLYGFVDCTLNYAGDGDLYETAPGRVTFHGRWELVESDCGLTLEDGLWRDSSNEAYHSFTFKDNDCERLDDWTAHNNAGAFDASGSGLDNQKFYISDMFIGWTPGVDESIDYEITETDYSQIYMTIFTDSDLSVDFNP